MAGYGSDSAFQGWLSDNGYTLPSGAPTAGVLRNRGSQYIDAVYGARFAGRIASFDQERQWPRIGAVANWQPIPPDTIPAAVVNASYFAAYQEATEPGSLQAVGSSAETVTREKVGQLEVQYANAVSDGTAASITPLISIVDGMLAPFLRDIDMPCLGIISIGGCR